MYYNSLSIKTSFSMHGALSSLLLLLLPYSYSYSYYYHYYYSYSYYYYYYYYYYYHYYYCYYYCHYYCHYYYYYYYTRHRPPLPRPPAPTTSRRGRWGLVMLGALRVAPQPDAKSSLW